MTAFFGGLHYAGGRRSPAGSIRNIGREPQLGSDLHWLQFDTFFPQFILGAEGMPRRYHVYPPEFQVWNVLSSGGAVILAVAYLMPMFYLGYSLFFGKRSPANSMGCAGTGMANALATPEHNFDVQPVVTRPPYQYSPSFEAEPNAWKPKSSRRNLSPPNIATRPPNLACGFSSRPKYCCSVA